jgi:hypothetical protein
VFAYRMFHTTHSEPRYKAQVNGHFHSPVALPPMKVILLQTDKEFG